MAIYRIGEQKSRPGVYLRTANRGKNVEAATVLIIPDPVVPEPEPTDGMTVQYAAGIVTLTLPKGFTVAYDEAGTVTISGPVSVTYDDAGNVTIGG